jgi:hypothetical protein
MHMSIVAGSCHMQVDWEALARQVGSLSGGVEQGGSDFAELALEQILGEAAIRDAVDIILDYRAGSELASSVLWRITSRLGTDVAYEEYESSSGERAARAVWLIKHIAHPRSLEWVRKFLRDDNVAVWGVALLDQLLWTSRVEPEAVEELLQIAERHAIPNVREQAAGIRGYLAARAEEQ